MVLTWQREGPPVSRQHFAEGTNLAIGPFMSSSSVQPKTTLPLSQATRSMRGVAAGLDGLAYPKRQTYPLFLFVRGLLY